MNWRYIARNLDNVKIQGTVEAVDEKALRIMLSEQNYYLIKAMPIKEKKMLRQYKKRMSYHTLANFCRQWAVMIKSGVDIRTSLQTVGSNSESKTLKGVLTMIYIDISKGWEISRAMAKFNDYFTIFFVHMVRVGEVSGNLSDVLVEIAEYFEREDKLERKVKQAFQYPKILMIFCFLVIIIISFFILPLFSKLFSNLRVELPLTIQIINSLTSFIKRYWSFLLSGLICFILLLKKIYQKSRLKEIFDRIKTCIPIYQRFLIATLTSKLTRALSVMLQSSITLTDGFPIVIPLMTNTYIEKKLQSVLQEVLEGKTFASSLKELHLFRSDLIEMIRAGEQSGELASILSTTSNYFDEQVMSYMQKLVSLIEPLLIVMIAGVILLIMSVVFFPLMDIMKLQM